MRPERLGGALALVAAACSTTPRGDCPDVPGRRIPSGPYALCPGFAVDVLPADPRRTVSPGEARVDLDAGVVTFTRDIDGGRVIARYRIVRR